MMVEKDLMVTSTMTMTSRQVNAGRNANAIHIARLMKSKDHTNIARFGKSVHIQVLEVETWIVTSVMLTATVAVAAVAAIISSSSIEGNSQSYNQSIFVFAGMTVKYEAVIFFDNDQHACVFLIGKMSWESALS